MGCSSCSKKRGAVKRPATTTQTVNIKIKTGGGKSK